MLVRRQVAGGAPKATGRVARLLCKQGSSLLYLLSPCCSRQIALFPAPEGAWARTLCQGLWFVSGTCWTWEHLVLGPLWVQRGREPARMLFPPARDRRLAVAHPPPPPPEGSTWLLRCEAVWQNPFYVPWSPLQGLAPGPALILHRRRLAVAP